MINFTRSFESSWERMMFILFRPFDLGKWFVIGFSAFLAGLLQGGNGFSGNFNVPNSNGNASKFEIKDYNAQLQDIHNNIYNFFTSAQFGFVVLIGLFVFGLIVAFALLFYWLGARGQFMFLDNIVRNRAAIVWPWHAYARRANSVFLFYLAYFAVTMVAIIPVIAAAIVAALPAFRHDRWPQGTEIPILVIIGLFYIVIAFGLTFILFVFREFGIPLMFRNGLMAYPAFKEALQLTRLHFGTVFVFVLLRIALSLAVGVLSILVCCFTCCIGSLPYLGTVVLLPALIYVRCFSLDCLAQFGPQYDVWTVDVPPTDPASSTTPVTSPLPPPG